MRRLVWMFLLCSAWSQVVPQVTVRDAYVESKTGTVREARLRDSLQVVVCKAEYDAAKGQNQTVSLYLDGHLIKGIDAARPADVDAKADADKQIAQDRQLCADNAKSSLAAADKTAADKAADAKLAADKAAAESDPTKKSTLNDASKAAAATAKTAQDTADTLKQSANGLYRFEYYLDPQLAAKAETKDVWVRLLEQPWDDRSIAVSVGPDNAQAWPSNTKIAFKRLNLWWLAGWVVVFVFAIILFVRYAKTSDIIRDTGTLPAPAGGGAPPQKAYSLARTQMALWTFLVAGALVFIFLVTWNENTINGGVLTLIGVSFGTTLLAATADAAQGDPPQTTKGFIADLLSDGSGPSFHRYQMVLFTVILAVIFVVKAATTLVMPEFDATLLGLMGISNGTYLGFKLMAK